MGFAVRVRSAGQKYGPTCHQRDRTDVTEFATLVRLSSLGQHVGVLALAGYKRRKSALTANSIDPHQFGSLRGSSTTHALVELVHQWQEALDKPGKMVYAPMLDFSKAVDRLDYNILQRKLANLGLPTSL